ncbi:MAG: hypothetical protein OXH52_04430 [Gammaproteobacteria bacterium]|nr:hypothetical protein [Gammaproteobacteria bacterium]
MIRFTATVTPPTIQPMRIAICCPLTAASFARAASAFRPASSASVLLNASTTLFSSPLAASYRVHAFDTISC